MKVTMMASAAVLLGCAALANPIAVGAPAVQSLPSVERLQARVAQIEQSLRALDGELRQLKQELAAQGAAAPASSPAASSGGTQVRRGYGTKGVFGQKDYTSENLKRFKAIYDEMELYREAQDLARAFQSWGKLVDAGYRFEGWSQAECQKDYDNLMADYSKIDDDLSPRMPRTRVAVFRQHQLRESIRRARDTFEYVKRTGEWQD